MERVYVNALGMNTSIEFYRRSVRGVRFRTYSEVIRRRGNRYKLTSCVDTGRPHVIVKPDPLLAVSPDLQILQVDLKISSNSRNHLTHEYDICEKEQHLVVRRGQTFDVSVTFNKQYDQNRDDLKLVFLAGDNPSPPKGTRVSLVLSDKDEEKDWGAWITKNEDRTLSVRINTPPTCYVGIWKLQIETIKKDNNKNIVFEYTHDQCIYVLFNPWCKDDQVYHPDKALLEEYILNDMGKIYTGNRKQINGKRWNFGQFEENILDCAMYLLNHCKLSWSVRGDAVKVTRKLSAVANSQDDNGILVGNWSGDYGGGKSPLDWLGSVAILNDYYKFKRPVRYGQCWVFSGVLTTLCRTLGIPSRSVTNFSSAHDCDGSISIDCYWSEDGEPIDELNNDSIWNFHVWNEVWMARPDLPQGYGGWQVIDATPQEASDGTYCCGPASMEAIKRGEVHLPYDTPFVFAEVNADRVNWELKDTAETDNVGIEKHSVGTKISTKLPKGLVGNAETFCSDVQREDITRLYKYEEGSPEERSAVIKANQNSTKKGLYDQGKKADVDFELVDKETVPYGNDFEILLKINNKSDETRTISGCISTSSMHYTGVPAYKIKVLQMKEEKVPAKSYKEIRLTVSFKEYYTLLVDQCHMKMSCLCKVQETKHTYVNQDTFRLVKPDISLKAPSTGRVGEQIRADVSFVNPLPCALTNCEITIEGPGLQNNKVLKQSNVPSQQTFRTTVDFVPRRAGAKEIVVSFSSKELSMVDGSCEINVI